METVTTTLLKNRNRTKMCSLLCCLSKSSKEKDAVSDDNESVITAALDHPFAAASDSEDHRDGETEDCDANAGTYEKEEEATGVKTLYETINLDRCIIDRSDIDKCQINLSTDGQKAPPSNDLKIYQSTVAPSLASLYPERVLVSELDTDDPFLQDESCNESKGERTTNKNYDNLVVNISNLFRRIIRPAKWPKTASKEISRVELSVFDEKRRICLHRQLFDRQNRKKARINSSALKEVLSVEKNDFSEVPLKQLEPTLPVLCPEEPVSNNKKPDLPDEFDDLGCGQGDAYRIPSHLMYAPSKPGKHHLEPQVFPVFSWTVPVYRTRLEAGGVSFTFGSGTQTSTSSEGQPSTSQPTCLRPSTNLPTPTVFSTSCPGPSNPTPMEVDEPSMPDGSLLNQLVELTTNSPIDNQLVVQQLKEDMQKQLELQVQLQQQYIQQEVEARLRQMDAAASAATPTDHVAFCEWTLVLRYPTNQKISDRPMGILGHEPLRNYKLSRQSADDQNIDLSTRDPISCPDPEPNPNSSKSTSPPRIPQPNPDKKESLHVCPKLNRVRSKSALRHTPLDSIKSEPTFVSPQSEPVKSESKPLSTEPHPSKTGTASKNSNKPESPNSAIPPLCPQSDPQNIEPKPGHSQSETGKSKPLSEPQPNCSRPELKKSEPTLVSPQSEPVKSESKPLSTESHPAKTEPASKNSDESESPNSTVPPVCRQSDPQKTEPKPGHSKSETGKSKPLSELQPNCTQPDPMRSEPAFVFSYPDPVESESKPLSTESHPSKSQPASHNSKSESSSSAFPPLCPQREPEKTRSAPARSQADPEKTERRSILIRPNSMISEQPLVSQQPHSVKNESQPSSPESHPAKSQPSSMDSSESKLSYSAFPPLNPRRNPQKTKSAPARSQADSEKTNNRPIRTRPNSMMSEPALVYQQTDPVKTESTDPHPAKSKPASKNPIESRFSYYTFQPMCPKRDPEKTKSAPARSQADPENTERRPIRTRLNSMMSEPVLVSQQPDPAMYESKSLSNEPHSSKTRPEFQNWNQPEPSHSQTPQRCPHQNPEKPESNPIRSQYDPMKSEPPPTCTRPDSTKSEPTIVSQKSNHKKSKSEPLTREPLSTETESVSQNSKKRSCVFTSPQPQSESEQTSNTQSSHAPASQECDNEASKQGIKHGLSEQTIFIKRPKKKHVIIKEENLDDMYNVF